MPFVIDCGYILWYREQPALSLFLFTRVRWKWLSSWLLKHNWGKVLEMFKVWSNWKFYLSFYNRSQLYFTMTDEWHCLFYFIFTLHHDKLECYKNLTGFLFRVDSLWTVGQLAVLNWMHIESEDWYFPARIVLGNVSVDKCVLRIKFYKHLHGSPVI